MEKDKDVKKKRNDQTPPTTPSPLLGNYNQNPLTPSTPIDESRADPSSFSSDFYNDQSNVCSSLSLNTPSTPNSQISSGGAKKVNVEVIMRSNPFRVGKFKKRSNT